MEGKERPCQLNRLNHVAILAAPNLPQSFTARTTKASWIGTTTDTPVTQTTAKGTEGSGER